MSNNHNHYNKNPLEYITTDIFDLITVNGRISKKLVEKVIIPEIDRYYESLQEITRLKKALEIANEAIGFYADKGNWFYDFGMYQNEFKSITEEDSEVFDIDGKLIPKHYGGKRAREAKKQIKELMESK